MINIKKFWKENKKEIIVYSIVGVSAAVAGVLLTKKYYTTNFWLDSKDLSVIAWKRTGKFTTLERVKEVLDANANNASTFAIVKEGSTYTGVVLSNDVIFP
jgi:predicted negative regulator of RcsB-dependent stress response